MYLRATSYPLSLLRFFAVCAVLLIGAVEKGYGQRVYAIYSGVSGGVGGEGGDGGLLGTKGDPGEYEIINSGNLTDDIYTNYAELMAISGKAGTGLLPDPGEPSTAWIELGMPQEVAANYPVFFKIDGIETNTGRVKIQTYKNGSAVGVAKNLSDLPITSNGEVIFTQNASFDATRIIAETGPGSPGIGGLLPSPSSINANLYYAYILDPNCPYPTGTSIGTEGVTLDLLGTGPKVINPYNAIDDDPENYSELTLGSGITIGLGSSVYQDVTYSDPSRPGYGFRVYLRSPASIVDLKLFAGLKIYAYDQSNNIVFEQGLDETLTLDLLGLLGDGELVTVDIYGNTGPFVKIRVALGNFLGVGILSSGIYFYGVEIIPPPPFSIGDEDNLSICEGDDFAISIPESNEDFNYTWYDSDDNVIGTGSTLTRSSEGMSPSGSPYQFRVTSSLINCNTIESTASGVVVNVIEKPGSPNLIITDAQN